MEKENFEIWMVEYLSGELDETGRTDFENYIKNSPNQQKEFDSVSKTWHGIDEFEIPKPSEKMDASFFEMLHVEIEKEDGTTVVKRILGPRPKIWTFFMFLHFIVAIAFFVFLSDTETLTGAISAEVAKTSHCLMTSAPVNAVIRESRGVDCVIEL